MATGKYRSTFDVHLTQQGTYKIATVNNSVFATWEENGAAKNWRGTADAMAREVPADAKGLKTSRMSSRVEVFVTSGKPTKKALEPTGIGLEWPGYASERSGSRRSCHIPASPGRASPRANLEVTMIPGGIRYRDQLHDTKATTDKDGKVTFTPKEPGMYWLNATIGGGRPGPGAPGGESRELLGHRRGFALTAVETNTSVIVAIPPSAAAEELQPAGRQETERFLQGETMGTSWSARFFAPPECEDSKYRNAVERGLQTVVDQMSHWLPESDLSRFNRSRAGSWQALPLEFFRVLDFALTVAEQSSGAFDPTVGPLVEEWGFGPGRKELRPPSPEVLSALRRTNGWAYVEVDRANQRARHAGEPGLDLSAVAKGFAVDHIGRLLNRHGVASYLVEIGGELRASGLKQNGEPWWVAIEPPAPIRIALSGWSVATSGDYRRYFESDGRRWTHAIDPRTGYALGQDVAQVSVIHPDCMAADAYSTALMVLGAKQGLEFADRMGLAAVFVLRSENDFEVRCSEPFYEMTEGDCL